MRIVAVVRDGAIQLRLFLDGLRQRALRTLVQHRDDAADHFQVAQFFGGDIEQQVLAACVVFGDCLREVTHCSGKFTLRTPELFQHQIGKTRVRRSHADGVLQAFVMYEHINGSLFLGTNASLRRLGAQWGLYQSLGSRSGVPRVSAHCNSRWRDAADKRRVVN